MDRAGSTLVVPRFAVLRNGVEFTQLRAVGSPTVRMSGSAALKMALSGTFGFNHSADFLTDRVRPYLQIAGTEYPLGEYTITESTVRHESNGAMLELSGYDNTYLAQRTRLEERLTLAAGNRYTDVVQALFIAAGAEKIICEESDERLKSDREDWETGTDHLAIANNLLKEINYESAWADMDGYIRIRRRKNPDAASIDHQYAAGEMSIIKDDCEAVNDLHGKCNVFRAEVNNPDLEAPMVAVAVNDDPSHPLCVQRIGRIAAATAKLDNIASREELQNYVDNLKFESMLGEETITFFTATNPLHTVGDTIAITHPHIAGIYTETEWELTLAAGAEMLHKARRVLYL